MKNAPKRIPALRCLPHTSNADDYQSLMAGGRGTEQTRGNRTAPGFHQPTDPSSARGQSPEHPPGTTPSAVGQGSAVRVRPRRFGLMMAGSKEHGRNDRRAERDVLMGRIDWFLLGAIVGVLLIRRCSSPPSCSWYLR